jgi:DUF2075 family protein
LKRAGTGGGHTVNVGRVSAGQRTYMELYRENILLNRSSANPKRLILIVYSATKHAFLDDNNDREIDDVIRASFFEATGSRVSESEQRSWRESLGYMARVLSDESIPGDAGVAIEYHIPQSAKRLDVLISGHAADGSKSAIIVELKQWDSVQVTTKDAIVRTFIGGGVRETVHPSYQAWSYAELMKSFNSAVYDGHISVWPCAYLHNHLRDGAIDSERYELYTSSAPLFLKGEAERSALRRFINKHIEHGDGLRVIREIEEGPIRPSKELADSVARLLRGNPEFVLIDDQKIVFEAARDAAVRSTSERPRVVIIEGGPGTGKSVVAINLLADLLVAGRSGKYVSKNAAPRRVYEAKLAGQMTATKYRSLFVGSGSFVEAPLVSSDFLVIDEAHRLNEKSGLYGNQGDHQVKEIIASSNCSIFFVDEDQRVTFKDVGTKAVIRQHAEARGAAIEEYQLSSQFRCAGSDGYLAWLDNVLEVRPTVNKILSAAEFDFRVFDTPDALHAAIDAKNITNRARVVAGYCWPWRSKTDSTATDINIGTYQRRWNLDEDGSLWIIAPESINEVGCIHTCQGLEVDYVGVIIGPDMTVEEGSIRTVPTARAKQDSSIKGYRAMSKTDPISAVALADLIVKNTYRTLMTRGMKGCYVYCTDSALRERLRSRLEP